MHPLPTWAVSTITTLVTSLATASVGALAVASSAGCGEAVAPEPLGDYASWKRTDAYGEIPGHGDSYRIIYANDVALSYAGGGYPAGSIIVKEVRQRVGDQPGDLKYVAIMRRLDAKPIGLAAEAGWLFTQAQTPGGSETYRSLCWNRCHVAAPFAGAFLDYGK
jgi:hypothetical protein